MLLEHYRDVQPGLVDTEPGAADGHALLASGPWKHHSYQQLERLLTTMRRVEPRLARHLLRRYLDYREVRRAWCRKCGYHASAATGRIHLHPPGRSVTLLPVVVRFAPDDVREAQVAHGIDWLASRWRGEVDLPHEIVRGTRVATSATLPLGVAASLPGISTPGMR